MTLAFRLAKDLGMTVGELMNRISEKEFHLWAIYYKTEYEMQERAARKK